MSERKINLDEIISKTYRCEDIYEFQRSFDISVSMIKEICINVCKQLLELAAENADYDNSFAPDRNKLKQSILNTIIK